MGQGLPQNGAIELNGKGRKEGRICVNGRFDLGFLCSERGFHTGVLFFVSFDRDRPTVDRCTNRVVFAVSYTAALVGAVLNGAG